MADGPDALEAFDALVAGLDAAMAVVTVAVADERDGCLVGFHSQCSIEPRRYVVWLSVDNRTCRLAHRATHLGVHALTVADRPVAELFGGTTGDDLPGGGDDKLAEVAWTAGAHGVPLLDDLQARFVGRITEWLEPAEGDHHAAVLEPVRATLDLGPAPLLHLRDAQDIAAGHPA